MFLKEVRAKKIKDSRNAETIEVSLCGIKASSPSGKSTGKHETPCWHKSIDWNIKFLNKLKSDLEINKFEDLKKVESLIKKEARLKDVKQFGANALVALEVAILKALAREKSLDLFQVLNKKPRKLPTPVGNAIGGGLHSHNKNHPTFQEFLLIPQGKTAKQNVQIMQSIHAKLKSKVKSSKKNDEGAWQTSLNNEQILEILSKYKQTRIGIDAAASAFFCPDGYKYKNKTLDRNTQIRYMNTIIKDYNLLYCEDPLEEEDFQGFSKIEHDKNHMVVGDDLTATQINRLKRGINNKAFNAIIVKPNQNGSLVELAEVFKICKKHNVKTILSHRSGETLDNALADLAVGFQADYMKAGISTKWREAKLNRLVEIERQIKKY